MTAMAGAPSTGNIQWKAIDWKTVEYQVRRLQIRIAKAIKIGRYTKAKALQWLLNHSFFAKLLAVKRVTQNTGKNTPGIDGVTWRTDKQKINAAQNIKRVGYKAQPLRRIYIPKKNGKLRPLGIPTMADRATQALHLLGLEPIAEIQADENSYGFRQKRSVHDAIAQCFTLLSRGLSAQWVLEGDIKACFDKISHEWLLENVRMDKSVLKQWIKAGYIDKDLFYDTSEGTPQGGIASPTLANIVLDGLEKAILGCAGKGEKIHFVRYADDFICTAISKEILEMKVKPIIIEFLGKRGLELSLEKTKITHIEEGFDFLGFNIRKYQGKLLIKPTKQGINKFCEGIRDVVHKMVSVKTNELIDLLNSKIRGWANYYQHCVSKRVFGHIDDVVFWSVWRMLKRRHPNKGVSWIRQKYFTKIGLRNWCFFTIVKKENDIRPIALIKAADTPIRRHIKVRGKATPFDPEYNDYFIKRADLFKRKKKGIAGLHHSNL